MRGWNYMREIIDWMSYEMCCGERADWMSWSTAVLCIQFRAEVYE